MKKKTLNLPLYFATVLLLLAFSMQSCSKKKDVDPGPVDPAPHETETLKLIPDSIFRAYLKANVCPNAFDASGKFIDITHPEVKNFAGAMRIDTLSCPRPFVASLKGLEYFTKLSKLDVLYSAIDSLNLKETMALDTVRLIVNRDLQHVNVKGCTGMRFIRISDIPAISLDFAGLPALEYVNLINLKRLTDVNVTNAAKLRHLMTVGLSAVQSIDVSTNPELRRLYLEYGYGIKSIDITHNPKLYGLVASYCTSLKSVDFSKNDSLRFVMLDDSNIDTVDFSHNPKLVSVAMLRTQLRNLDLRSNPLVKLLYLDGCYLLNTVDLRAQTSFDYYSIDYHKYYQMGQDDANMVFQYGFVSDVPTATHTLFQRATRKGVDGATENLFGGLRLPIFQDAGFLSLTNVLTNEANKNNYSFVMSRRVLAGQTPARITTYAADQATVICHDYDPTLFKCN